MENTIIFWLPVVLKALSVISGVYGTDPRNASVLSNLTEESATTLDAATSTACANESSDICDLGLESSTSAEVSTTEVSVPTVRPTALAAAKHNVTTTVAPKSNATSAAAEETEHLMYIPLENCNCDLMKNVCDINCCCDKDCSADERLVFSRCYQQRPVVPPDSRHCYSSQFIYRNNTPLALIREHSTGMFCIAVDNLPARFIHQNQPIITSQSQFEKVARRHKSYRWPVPTELPVQQILPVFNPAKEYKAGDFIWLFDNASSNAVSTLRLPKKLVSTYCDSSLPVKYLSNWAGSCLRQRPTSEIECHNGRGLSIHTFYNGFKVISSPVLMNNSSEDCPGGACVSVKTMSCLDSEEITCTPITQPLTPQFDVSQNACLNTVQSVHYLMYHNGTRGITDVTIFVRFVNTSMEQMDLPLRQEMKVTFRWQGQGQGSPQRSGRPGYLVGSALFVARKRKKANDTLEPQGLLSVPEYTHLGNCDLHNRRNVLFGQNLRSECLFTLDADTTCWNHQTKVWQLLLRNDSTLNETEPELFVSSYGDPSTGEWVPALWQDGPPSSDEPDEACPQFTFGIDMRILTSRVGAIANPQTKIIGVLLRGLQKPTYPCLDSKAPCTVSLVSLISFVDTTLPAIAQFAEPPVYEIKLPPDFFYPFFFSASATLNPCFTTLLVILTFTIG